MPRGIDPGRTVFPGPARSAPFPKGTHLRLRIRPEVRRLSGAAAVMISGAATSTGLRNYEMGACPAAVANGGEKALCGCFADSDECRRTGTEQDTGHRVTGVLQLGERRVEVSLSRVHGCRGRSRRGRGRAAAAP